MTEEDWKRLEDIYNSGDERHFDSDLYNAVLNLHYRMKKIESQQE